VGIIEVGEAVSRKLPILVSPEEDCGGGEKIDEAGAADEMSVSDVVDRSVIVETVEEPAVGVQGVRPVKLDDGHDMVLQEVWRGELGKCRYREGPFRSGLHACTIPGGGSSAPQQPVSPPKPSARRPVRGKWLICQEKN
jgi:hypothetical protein